jgi:DNA-directed RNA polymerase specialized sigma subunit
MEGGLDCSCFPARFSTTGWLDTSGVSIESTNSMASKNPIEAFENFRTKEGADRAQEDLRLWHHWDQNGRTAEALEPLMKRYEPLLARSQKAWKAPAVNPAAFRAELQKHFINAAGSFDPNQGAAFNTHVQTRLKKALRYNTQHQNVGYIPEDKARRIGSINRAADSLQEDFGRAPTNDEIGQQIGMKGKQVEVIRKGVRRDIPGSVFEEKGSDPIEFMGSREQDVIRLMTREPERYLSPEEVTVFRHIYGAGSPKVSGTGELARKLNMSQSRISRLKSSIGAKIKQNI